DAPRPDERHGHPAAYICMFVDTGLVPMQSAAYVDAGIAAQTIMLGACEKGLGGCIVSSFDHTRLKHALMVTIGAYEPLLVIALGKPCENIILEESGYDTDCYLDSAAVRHVPKRQLTDIIIGI
ncbi:MAG: nitroreductase family protein, partial [Acetanaerobacterium sp.]